VLGQHRSLVGPVRRSDVFANEGVAVEDADLVLGLVDNELSVDQRLVDGIPMGMQVDIALVVNDACHTDVGYRNMQRQRAERGLLGRVQLDRFGANRPFRFRVGPFAPRPKLCVAIGLVGKRPSRVEVILDMMKRPFDARRAIGVAQPVRTKDKSEAVGEGRHLRRHHRVLTRAAGHDDTGVVDHALAARSAKIGQGLGQKHLGPEASPPRVQLRVVHARIAKDQRGALHPALDAPDYDVVRGRVVLHLLAGLELIMTRGLFGRLANAVPAAKTRQGRVR